MDEKIVILLAADTLLIIHALFIAFVVFGLILIIAGLARGWRWVRNPWFRFIPSRRNRHRRHTGLVECNLPFDGMENSLREKAGEATYAGSFIQHWLHKLIFYQAEAWVFTLSYTVFGTLVVLAWYLAPPSSFPRRRESSK